MVDIILTESQRTQCSMQTLDLIAKAAMAGAVGYVLYYSFIKEGVMERGAPGRFLKRMAGRFSRGGGGSEL